MTWCAQIGDKPRQGKRQGQAAERPDPPSFGECNVCKEVTKPEAKEIKDHPVAYLCSVDDIGGRTKSDQHGRSVCRLRHGSARAFGRQAFLRWSDSRMSRYGILAGCNAPLAYAILKSTLAEPG